MSIRTAETPVEDLGNQLEALEREHDHYAARGEKDRAGEVKKAITALKQRAKAETTMADRADAETTDAG
jgi:hypothetical protein